MFCLLKYTGQYTWACQVYYGIGWVDFVYGREAFNTDITTQTDKPHHHQQQQESRQATVYDIADDLGTVYCTIWQITFLVRQINVQGILFHWERKKNLIIPCTRRIIPPATINMLLLRVKYHFNATVVVVTKDISSAKYYEYIYTNTINTTTCSNVEHGGSMVVWTSLCAPPQPRATYYRVWMDMYFVFVILRTVCNKYSYLVHILHPYPSITTEHPGCGL